MGLMVFKRLRPSKKGEVNIRVKYMGNTKDVFVYPYHHRFIQRKLKLWRKHYFG